MKIRTNKLTPALILGAGILLRILYLYQFSTSPLFSQALGPDVQEYDQWARRILVDGLWWRTPQIHAPLYPVFLAMLYRLFDMNLLYVRFFQQVICLISFYPLYLQIRHRFQHRKGMAELFLGIAALYPPLIYYTAELTSEALLLTLLNLALFLIWRGAGKSILLVISGGVCAGLAAITHPLSLAFSLSLAVFTIYRSRTGKRLLNGVGQAAVYVLIIILVILPVAWHNYSLKGNPGMIQNNSGFNLFVGNSPKATGGCWVRPGPLWDQLHYDAEQAVGVHAGSKDKYFADKAYEFMWKQPGTFVLLLLKKAAYVWNWQEMPAGADIGPLRFYTSMQRFFRWTFGVVALCGMLGFYLAAMKKRDRNRIMIFLLTILFYWGALTLTVVSSRYRLPLLAGVFVAAAYALIEIWRKRGNLPLGVRICGVLAACLIFLVPAPEANFELSEADSLLGEAYYRQGDMIRAREYLNRAVIAEPWSRTQCLLGATEKNLGNRSRARELFELASKVSPNDPMGQMNLGIMASEENRPALAEKHFQSAMKLGDKNPETLYNYAVFKMKLNDLKTAEVLLKESVKFNQAHRLSLNQLGVCLMRQGKYSEAVDVFAAAARLESDNHGVSLNLATAYLASGQKSQAKPIIDHVLTEEPNNPTALQLRKLMEKMKN